MKCHSRPKNPKIPINKLSRRIRRIVCKECNITIAQFFSKSRKVEYVTARQYFAKLCYPIETKKNIGRLMNRKHSTAICSIKQFECYSQTEKKYLEKYNKIASLVKLC